MYILKSYAGRRSGNRFSGATLASRQLYVDKVYKQIGYNRPEALSLTSSDHPGLFHLFCQYRFFFGREPGSPIVVNSAAFFAERIPQGVNPDNIFTLTTLEMINWEEIHFGLIKNIFTCDYGLILTPGLAFSIYPPLSSRSATVLG